MKKQLKVILLVGLIVSMLFSTNLVVFADDLGSWETKANTIYSRYDISAVAVDGKIYVIGGYTSSGGESKIIEEYNIADNTWISKGAVLSTARWGAAAVEYNGKIYIFGGYGAANLKTTEVYDPASNTTIFKASAPTARRYARAVVVNNKIYVIGGTSLTLEGVATVEVYDPETDTWATKKSMNMPRWASGVAAVNGKIYVFGGSNGGGGYIYNATEAIEEYDPETDIWTIKGNMPTAKLGIEAVAAGDKIYIFGGESKTTFFDEVVAYDTNTGNWSTIASMPGVRSDYGKAEYDNKVYIIDGRTTNSTVCTNIVYSYTLPNMVIAAPPDLSVVAGDQKADLSWTAVDGSTSYSLKRATTAGGPYESIATGITGTKYADTGLTNGTTYYYIVTAVNSAGESNPSNEASATPFKPETKPEAPINLTAVGWDSKVDLTWNATEGASNYTVKRSTTAGGPYAVIAENIIATNYSDTDVTNGTTYYYIVTASNAEGESEPSNEASATPTGTQQPPQNGDRAILVVTMTNGTIAEYDLSMTEVNAFVKWYEDKADGSGKAVYTINKNSNVAPFLSRKDYLNFDKIYSFEVKEYKIN